jgi:hypothetical protein
LLGKRGCPVSKQSEEHRCLREIRPLTREHCAQ